MGVSDGDTITVLDDAKVQHKIRLAGIDAPEKGQAFGERSKQRLSDLVFQKRVEVRCHKKDRYKREVPDQPSSGRATNLAPLNESVERLLFEDPIDRSGSIAPWNDRSRRLGCNAAFDRDRSVANVELRPPKPSFKKTSDDRDREIPANYTCVNQILHATPRLLFVLFTGVAPKP